MNKFLVYTLTAILLGSVLMTTPLLLIEPNRTLNGTENTQTQDPNTTLSPEAPDSQEPEYQTETDRGFAQTTPEESTDSLDQIPAPEAPEEPKTTDEPEPQEVDTTSLSADPISNLNSIALMIVPSFLIAISVFVYMKKKTR